MINTLFRIRREAKRKLTNLGKLLINSYLTFIALSFIAMFMGVITLIQKCFHMNTLLNAAWWELIALIIISWLLMRLFFRVALDLVDLKYPLPISDGSNVIPFERK